MIIKETLKSDERLQPIRNKEHGVKNHRKIRVLRGCGMFIDGYGTKTEKRLYQQVKVCSPGHYLEHRTGRVKKIEKNRVLVEFKVGKKLLTCWFTHNELKAKWGEKK